MAGDYVAALDAAPRAERQLTMSFTIMEAADYYFYSALSYAALCNALPAAQRVQMVGGLASHHRQLASWAEACPENFEDRAATVGAEIARLAGRELEAEQLYEQAIRSSQANGFVQNEALANELAARFYAARGFEKHMRICGTHDTVMPRGLRGGLNRAQAGGGGNSRKRAALQRGADGARARESSRNNGAALGFDCP
jgi:hypothetical protein